MIERIEFRAVWNQTNQHLREKSSKAAEVAWKILSILPPVAIASLIARKIGKIANKMTLPAAHLITQENIAAANERFRLFWLGPITEENKHIRNHFSMHQETVISPDGVELSAIWIKHKDADKTAPTIIYFNGNYQLSVECQKWPFEKAIETHSVCNFVFFDYRGVGNSKGKFCAAKDLVVDGSSIVQWVKDRIGTPPDKIIFYGFSLGGAISSLTQALDLENLTGRNINDRSFASSEDIIHARFGKGLGGKFFAWAFKRQGYSADPASAFKKLKGEKLIIHHPKDTIIPPKAGMHAHVKHDNVLSLHPKPEFEDLSTKRHHIARLDWHEGALEKVVRFLFDLPVGKETLCTG